MECQTGRRDPRYTFLLNFLANGYPHSYKKLPYDPIADFAVVGMGAKFDLAFAVGPAVPPSVKNMTDFVAWCKANPANGVFGSPAAGSTPHFVGAIAGRAAGIELTHVPYRGPTPAVTDTIGGQIAAASSTVGDFPPYVQAGRCRILATTGARRSTFVPDAATFLEHGSDDEDTSGRREGRGSVHERLLDWSGMRQELSGIDADVGRFDHFTYTTDFFLDDATKLFWGVRDRLE